MLFIHLKIHSLSLFLGSLKVVYNWFLLNKQGRAEDQRGKEKLSLTWRAKRISWLESSNFWELISKFATCLSPSVSAESCNKDKTGKNFLCCWSQRELELSWNWASPGAGECMRLQISIPASSSWGLMHCSPLRQRPLRLQCHLQSATLQFQNSPLLIPHFNYFIFQILLSIYGSFFLTEVTCLSNISGYFVKYYS